MADYLQYHNEETLRRPVEVVAGEPFHIFTNKSTKNSVGERVWLISGSGTPRTYQLCCTFVVDEAGPHNGEFKNSASGRRGVEFPTRPVLNDLPWFRDLWKSQARFSLGFQQLAPEFAQEFEALARALPEGAKRSQGDSIE